MTIEEIGITNFKSFDTEGIIFPLDKKINVFIGKNNSGKSNILFFLKLLSEFVKKWGNFPRALENEFKRNGQDPAILITLNLSEAFQTVSEMFKDDDLAKFKFSLPNFNLLGKNPLDKFDEKVLIKLQTQYSSADKRTLLKVVLDNTIGGLKNSLSFFGNLIYIPHFREINDLVEQGDNIFDGRKIISKLFEMQNPNVGEESKKEKFYKIQTFVRDLLGEPNLIIEVPHTKDKIIVELYGNRLSLQSYGTGLHELIIICSAITIYDDYVFCIEEPELHLHPELQRKFIQYLISLNNYFFITTHSNVFIDYNPMVNLYHVVHDKESTKIHRVLSNQQSYEILNDLGYKSSDIIQSNGIVWVEGPSDRVYLNKWISLLNPNFIEGIHYSIMFYGGKLLSHLTLEDEDNGLIKLLKINRNAIVIIDRDGINSITKINETKTRIQNETSEGNCWITKGREIENYLSEEVVIKFLSIYDKNLKFKFDRNKKISENILKSNRKSILDYSSNKVKYSKEIVNHITEHDLSVLDLKSRLKHLIAQIEIWNKK